MSADEQNKFVHGNFPHLSVDEWNALIRMTNSMGTEAVAAMLSALGAEGQHAKIFAFVQREADEARNHARQYHEQVAELQKQVDLLRDRPTNVVVEKPQRPETLKIDVSKYRGAESESLLRWLVELNCAIEARGIRDSQMQVAFAMSNLAGRAKTWAFGKKLANYRCFKSFDEFTHELRLAFEPPKTEFRARAEFLDLKQGKRDIHAYSQLARYLTSCIVTDPVDDQTQVVTFMKGLNDGPIKTYLFREYPESLEHAISLAIQEDFSLNQAHVHSLGFKPPRQRGGDTAEPMDLSTMNVARDRATPKWKQQQQRVCHRCQKSGHFAQECPAPRPVRNNPNAARNNQFNSLRNTSNQQQRRVNSVHNNNAGRVEKFSRRDGRLNGQSQ